MTRIVILGGGYSSVWCYRAIRRWMGDSARITVVAPFQEHVFHGFTGEVLEGGLKPEMLVSPLDEVIPRAERVQGWATSVDAEARRVTVEWQGRTRIVEYDELVVATGAKDRIDHLPGLAEHGWSLRSPGRVEALLEPAVLAHGDDPHAGLLVDLAGPFADDVGESRVHQQMSHVCLSSCVPGLPRGMQQARDTVSRRGARR